MMRNNSFFQFCMLLSLLFVQTSYSAQISFMKPENGSTCGLPAEDPPLENGGYCDGKRENARFQFMNGITHDSKGNLYLATYKMIRKVTPDGVVTTIAGNAMKHVPSEGVGTSATFNAVSSIAISTDDELYITSNLTLSKMNLSTRLVSLYAGASKGKEVKSGQRLQVTFIFPRSVTVDHEGNVYEIDGFSDSIRKISTNGIVSTLLPAQNTPDSYDDKTGSTWSFGEDNPNYKTNFKGMAVDSIGNLYVTDWKQHVVRRITPDGQMVVWAGVLGKSGCVDGIGTQAQFFRPEGIAIDSHNNLYVADTFNRVIRKITPDRLVTTIAGKAGYYGSVDGVGSNARFVTVNSLTVMLDGTIYVTDTAADQIRKITPDGLVTTFAGKPGFSVAGQDSKGDIHFFSN